MSEYHLHSRHADKRDNQNRGTGTHEMMQQRERERARDEGRDERGTFVYPRTSIKTMEERRVVEDWLDPGWQKYILPFPHPYLIPAQWRKLKQ